MFTKKELATIMSALMDKEMFRKTELSNKEYECEEEKNSLIMQIDVLKNLTYKVSKLLNE